MRLHDFPERIFLFDMNGTLDCSSNTNGTFVLPTKELFAYLKTLDNVWVGVCSGMYTWMQLQEITDWGVTPDFVIQKHTWPEFVKSLEHIYKREFDSEVNYIGDEDEDVLFADKHDFRFFTPVTFWNDYRIKIEGDFPVDSYQDQLFPDHVIKGFKDTEKTWENIKMDFTGKTVLDIGCNLGYFMVQVLRSGATKAIGIDLNGTHITTPATACRKPINVAKEILGAWGFLRKARLIEGNWEYYEISEQIDVVLCLSVCHYWKNEYEGIRKVFRLRSETLIFECRRIASNYIESLFVEYDYSIIERKQSHWNEYIILILKRNV